MYIYIYQNYIYVSPSPEAIFTLVLSHVLLPPPFCSVHPPLRLFSPPQPSFLEDEEDASKCSNNNGFIVFIGSVIIMKEIRKDLYDLLEEFSTGGEPRGKI